MFEQQARTPRRSECLTELTELRGRRSEPSQIGGLFDYRTGAASELGGTLKQLELDVRVAGLVRDHARKRFDPRSFFVVAAEDSGALDILLSGRARTEREPAQGSNFEGCRRLGRVREKLECRLRLASVESQTREDRQSACACSPRNVSGEQLVQRLLSGSAVTGAPLSFGKLDARSSTDTAPEDRPSAAELSGQAQATGEQKHQRLRRRTVEHVALGGFDRARIRSAPG
jgi:hypothetical protein